jgi:myo-inositol-hexaphosphate 3-phosphohydrolase
MPWTRSSRGSLSLAAAFAAVVVLTMTRVAAAAVAPPSVLPVAAGGETAPVGHSGDAADDPAIWVHPSDPSRSVVIGNDKQGALEVYDLVGTRGIAAHPGGLGPRFPTGLFVCQDNDNTTPGSKGRQNFKLVQLGTVVAL